MASRGRASAAGNDHRHPDILARWLRHHVCDQKAVQRQGHESYRACMNDEHNKLTTEDLCLTLMDSCCRYRRRIWLPTAAWHRRREKSGASWAPSSTASAPATTSM